MRKVFTEHDRIVPVHYPRVLVETAATLGADRAALLENTGISLSAFETVETRFSYSQYGALIGNALRLTGDTGLGLRVGRNLRTPQIGIVGLALATSPTIGHALHTWLRYATVVAPAWALSVDLRGDRAFLVVRQAIPRGRHEVFATETLVLSIDTQGRELLGRSLPIRALRFAYPRPPHADRYPREIHDVPLEFGAGVTEVEFDTTVLGERLPFADPAMNKLAEQYCVLHLPPDETPWGLIERMRTLLGATTGAPPDLEDVARRLRTSPVTLRHALTEMGTSYRRLLEEARKARVRDLARSTRMSVDEMAEVLGFRSPRSFRRAFKRWTGGTPESFRRQHR